MTKTYFMQNNVLSMKYEKMFKDKKMPERLR